MTPSRHRRHIIGMPGRIFVAPHHSTEELERRYKAADDGIERGHLQIIWLLSQGRSAKFVAEVTGYTPTWVSKILWRYNDHGLAGLGDGRLDNPGAAPLLDEVQLEELRDVVSEPPPDGGLWTGRKVACWITGRIGRTVSPQRGVEYLRRLDLTRQVPRPANPKASLYEQARFKKSSRPGSPSSKAAKRRFRSRSGRLMNIASD
jgi:transposase